MCCPTAKTKTQKPQSSTLRFWRVHISRIPDFGEAMMQRLHASFKQRDGYQRTPLQAQGEGGKKEKERK